MSPRCEIPAQELVDLLNAREAESTTALQTGLAIPHIVVEGLGRFDIAVARSKSGINFGDNLHPVHIVFALTGSKDERNFHLQCLVAIAQIVQNSDFLKNWRKARDIEELRNLILLAERIRRAAL